MHRSSWSADYTAGLFAFIPDTMQEGPLLMSQCNYFSVKRLSGMEDRLPLAGQACLQHICKIPYTASSQGSRDLQEVQAAKSSDLEEIVDKLAFH